MTTETYTVNREKHTKLFLYTVLNLTNCYKKLVHIVLSKFVIQKYKHFSTHLNNVSTLPCETWHSSFASEQQLDLRTQKHTKCFRPIFYKTKPILIKFGTCFPG